MGVSTDNHCEATMRVELALKSTIIRSIALMIPMVGTSAMVQSMV